MRSGGPWFRRAGDGAAHVITLQQRRRGRGSQGWAEPGGFNAIGAMTGPRLPLVPQDQHVPGLVDDGLPHAEAHARIARCTARRRDGRRCAHRSQRTPASCPTYKQPSPQATGSSLSGTPAMIRRTTTSGGV